MREIDPFRAWQILRDAVEHTGWWPLLVDENAGPRQIEAFLRRNHADESRTPAELLTAAAAQPYRHAEKIEEDPEDCGTSVRDRRGAAGQCFAAPQCSPPTRALLRLR